MAMHQTSSVWSRAFPHSPWSFFPAAPFGSEVWFRAKIYKGTKEKKHDATDVRWKKGWYRGPSTDVSRGHLLLRADGGLVIAKSVKFQELRDLLLPTTAEGVPSEGEHEKPVTKKQLSEEIKFTARKLLSEENYEIDEVVKLYYKLEELGDTDFRIGKKTTMSSWYTGAFVHGGCTGLRRNVYAYPNTTKYLAQVAKKFAKGEKFTAVGIARNATLGLHRDVHNFGESVNIVVRLTTFQGGGLWQQDPEAQEELNVTRELSNGQVLCGRVHEAEKGEPIFFSPSRWHEVQPWQGERVMLVIYTPRATKLKETEVEMLQDHGFEVDPKALSGGDEQQEEDLQEQEEVKLSALNAGEQQPTVVFIELEDNEIFDTSPYLTPAGTLRDLGATSNVEIKATLKKAEVPYTPNIEEILEECVCRNSNLYTVSLQDVKRKLGAWKASAVKEYENLKNHKHMFVVRKRHELIPGCQIIPCKGVFTAKPDKTEFYRRKTRFVGCGNHIPDGQEDMDLFATGIDATSLRTMSSASIDQPWSYGTTDIRQAFVLAPWRGQRVALQPLAIAYELGLSEAGDYWLVEMALYGLRQSPALWSQFRDEQLAKARFKATINGQEEELRVIQMVMDNQVWKIVRCQGDQEPLGYVMVYPDDLLVNALPAAMDSF